MLHNEAGERSVEGYERTRNAAMIKDADYILSLKENQKTLYKDVKLYFKICYQKIEKG